MAAMQKTFHNVYQPIGKTGHTQGIFIFINESLLVMGLSGSKSLHGFYQKRQIDFLLPILLKLVKQKYVRACYAKIAILLL